MDASNPYKSPKLRTMGTEGTTRKQPRIRWLILGIVCLCLFWGGLLYFADGMGVWLSIGCSGLLAWVLIAGFSFARWGRRGLAGAIFAAPVALYLLLSVEFKVISLVLLCMPPPRPMFCNNFVYDDRAPLPYWRHSTAIADRFGHWGWADYEDNLLLIVVTGVPATGVSGTTFWEVHTTIPEGMHESTITIGDGPNERSTVLQRTQNALVVILPNGDSGHFALNSGLARQFHEERRYKDVENVLREAGELLEHAEKMKFVKFLAGNTEPQPK